MIRLRVLVLVPGIKRRDVVVDGGHVVREKESVREERKRERWKRKSWPFYISIS